MVKNRFNASFEEGREGYQILFTGSKNTGLPTFDSYLYLQCVCKFQSKFLKIVFFKFQIRLLQFSS